MNKSVLTIKYSRKILNNLLIFVFSLSVWVNSLIMFMWRTYYDGIFRIPLTIFKYLGLIALVLFWFLNNKKLKIKRVGLLEFAITFILIIKILLISTYKTTPYAFSYWIIPVYVFFLMQLEESEKRLILKYLVVLFFVFTVPSIIYLVSINFGIELPYSILYSDQELKVQNYTYYLHYPMGLIFNQWGFLRPCGIFDEPGFIGTTAAMLFAIRLQEGIGGKNIWLLVGLFLIGISSTSLAAVILCIIAILVYVFIQKIYKAVGLILVLFVLSFLFMNIEFNNDILNNFQERLTITNGSMQGNNRESEIFRQEFEAVVKNDTLTLFFGKGLNSKSELLPADGSCSYRTFIYENGLIGFALLIFLIVTIFFRSYKSKYSLIHLCVFLISLYQRPYIIMPLYITIYIVGFSVMGNNSKFLVKYKRRIN